MATETAAPEIAGLAPPAAVPAPIRVLHLHRRFHPDYTSDGIRFVRVMARLASRGIGSEVLAYETTTPGGETLAIHQGLPVHYIANRRGQPSYPALLRWLLANLRRFDVLHLHAHADRQFISCLLARLFGVRVLFSGTQADGPAELVEAYRPRNRWLVGLLLHAINAFVVTSPRLFRRSLESVAAARLCFIPPSASLGEPPVPAADRAAARASLGLAADDLVLLHVGSVSRRENIAFLVEALARTADPSVRLVVVGPVLEDDYATEIEAQIAALGLRDRVMFTGFQDAHTPYYTAADAFVFASAAECFPDACLEAMAKGLPIISHFLPGLTDFIVDHGRTGFLAGSLDQFVEAIEHIRADPALRESMGLAGRRFAERNLDIGSIADRYAELYRKTSRHASPPHAAPPACPNLHIRFSGALAEGPAALGLEEFDTPTHWPPLLQVVIDTEADFDWDRGISTDVGRVVSISGLDENFDSFRKHGIRPSLVIDHPVATHAEGGRIVRRLAEEGCEIGVHLHSWTTPPMVEPRDDWHSFSGNMGAWLERRKLATLTHRVEALTGRKARIFKAGRYGLGPNTVDALEAEGFEIDLSICPWYDYSALGGPDFSRFTARPGWFGASRRLLSLPTTAAPLGWLGPQAHLVTRVTRGGLGRQLGLGRIAARANAFYPLRLSPEGADLGQMIQVTRQLHARGLRVFTLSLHSPTLQVGNTPYVRSVADLRELLGRIDRYCTFFRDELGGVFSDPADLHRRLSGLSATQPAAGRPRP
ncbi:hypothetical protein GCM10011504_07870 [Siccirubricoccus deserti]|uniref:Glycosyltransferase n=1 Tax=Siccirubricoccus deserti TaxID=2013562 RepID=A0A9X0QXP5_9PROT|nr:glycosyltransferase [Siccirubricoccus deserti]MBC4014537.1 glycosyltransferase [Siccirubricoccus deserti]GGC32099.1 hypothetical protein GCM10011504_07870 [Siccirubricoccus deserti]